MDTPLEMIDRAVETFGNQWRADDEGLFERIFHEYAAQLRGVGAGPEFVDRLFKDLLSREIHKRLEMDPHASVSTEEYRSRFPDRRQQIDEAFAQALPASPKAHPSGPLGQLAWELPQRENMLGPYERLQRLGAGGMGEVWLVRHTRTRRRFALKHPRKNETRRSGANNSSSARDLLLTWREAESQGELTGLDNIVQIEEVYIPPIEGVAEQELERVLRDDPPYIVMEYVEGGRTFADVLRGECPRNRAIEILAETAQALADAHARGVYHRDVKPANILLTPAGQVKLADFGLAVPFEDQSRYGFAGTLLYMAPEQIQVRTAGANSAPDIWALGVMLYQGLAGRMPFANDYEIVNHHPQPLRELDPTIPPELAAICERCLRKNPADRYESAADVAQALRAWREQQEIDQSLFPPPDYFEAYLHERRTGAPLSKSGSSRP